MPRVAFTQADVAKAIRGARAAGIEPREVRVRHGGEIVIVAGRATEAKETSPDVLDEIEGHFGHGSR